MSRKDMHAFNNIRDRVRVLLELNLADEDEILPEPEALADKIAEVIYAGWDLNFRLGMALGDLQIHPDNNPPVVIAFSDALDDLDIRPL